MNSKWNKNLAADDKFTILSLINELKPMNKKIGLIIDISYSDNYYNFDRTKSENSILQDIEYKKIKVRFNEIPHKSEMNKIYDLINKNIYKDHLIVIHCTYGVNRTGYAICYFLCKKFQISVKDAIERFEKARGHKIMSPNYIEDLYERFERRSVPENMLPMKMQH